MDGIDLIRVHGPIDLLTSEGERSVGSGMSRRLLGALVLGAGRAVPVSRLQGTMWGDHPPASAESSIQTYVSRLRHLLGHDTIVRVDHSYRLDAEREQIDAIRFEDLVIRATEVDDDPHLRRTVCRDALALWRGDPFGEFVDDEPFQLEAQRLDRLRVTVMEFALESELALGHTEIAAAELESVIEEYPYRERLWHLLMEALLRDGQRVKALRVGQRLREHLRSTGLEASTELCDLEARAYETGADPPAQAPARKR